MTQCLLCSTSPLPVSSVGFTGAQVGHGGGQLQICRVVCCHADFNGACPFVYHLVNTDLEHLVGAQWPAAQHHTMVKVVGCAGEEVSLDSLILTTTLVIMCQHACGEECELTVAATLSYRR